MKKPILLAGIILLTNLGSAQEWSPNPATLTTNIFRTNAVGVGYSSAPSFGTNLFMVNGNSYFSGNVGIGTTSPTSKLHLASGDFRMNSGKLYLNFTPPGSPILIGGVDIYGLHSTKSILLNNPDILNFSMGRNDGITSSLFDIGMSHCDGCWSINSKKGDIVLKGNSVGSYIFANEKGGTIKFETTSDPTNGTTTYNTSKTRILIDKYGNVGIGTGDALLNSNELLAVNGLIHTKEVKVDLIAWPDYVFKEDYNLISLEELEKQINLNGHLPNIPSEKEVVENGVNLGEMNKKLLEKIEELTLYLIELNKEVETLKAQINK